MRVYPGVGPDRVQLTRATFNDGRIVGLSPETTLLSGMPLMFRLHANVPDPFNPETAIRFDLPRDAAVHLEVFDVLGQRMLASGTLSAGMHRVVWDGRNGADAQVASGVYFYRLQA